MKTLLSITPATQIDPILGTVLTIAFVAVVYILYKKGYAGAAGDAVNNKQ